ncbi:MAG: type II toxin-antitoxin system VapC family toxin [Acidobacteriota bacterium]
MVIDSSALLSIFYKEDDAEEISAKIDKAERVLISTPTMVEAWTAVLRKRGHDSAIELDHLIRSLLVEVVDFNEMDAVLAREAYLRFGKGFHPARLNLGDCFSYALAKRLRGPLLYKGDDFTQTDIERA